MLTVQGLRMRRKLEKKKRKAVKNDNYLAAAGFRDIIHDIDEGKYQCSEQEKMNWIDVKKKLPEKLGNGMAMTRCVLVTVSDGGDPYYGETLGVTEAFYRFDTERWFNAGSGLLVKTVTHWQPMPPAAGG